MNIRINDINHSSLFPHVWFIFVINVMNTDYQIPEPFLFNPLKHHIGFIKEFINNNIDYTGSDPNSLTKDLKHLGTSVMDIYTGSLSIRNICVEAEEFLKQKEILISENYATWVGTKLDCFMIISLSDSSQWTLKFHDNPQRFVHFFPARNSQHTFRVKSNTLKSALIYLIIIGKDLVTGDDLNKVRPLLGLSPVKDSIDTEAILEMIEILRG
jgi:hypothetical protein